MDTNTTLSLIQTALVLGISVRETLRLVRERRLRVHHVAANRVKHFDASAILSYINATKE